MRYLLAIIFCFSCPALLLTACQDTNSTKQSTSSVNSVQDATGFTLKIKTVKRIVCLFEPILDELYMLGIGDRVQGVPVEIVADADYYQDYSKLDTRIRDKIIATPGTESAPNVEQIVNLAPDLVILESSQTKVADKLRSMQIPVYLCKSQEYEDIIKELRDLAKLTGRTERADSLVLAVESELAYIAKQNKAKTPKRAYFTWAYGKIFSTIGKQSMMNTCLKLAGVENVCQTDLYRVDITPERLIAWNPDLIITWNDSASKFYNRREFQTINAVKNSAVHNLLPMFFYNPHNIKSICTALRINGVAYGILPANNQHIINFLSLIYGTQIAPKLLTNFRQ